jgi:signal transduction histidine kinase
MRGWGRLETWAAAALTAIGLLEALLGLTVGPQPWPLVLTVPLVTAPVAWLRRAPVAALSVLLATFLAQALLGSDLGGGFAEPVALVSVLFGTAAGLRLVPGLAAALAAFAVLTAVMVATDGELTWSTAAYAAVVVGIPWVFGQGVRLANERTRLVAERADLLEREAERQAAAVAAAERARLARELHDVVAHNISAIVVQSGAERRALGEGHPVTPVLTGIEEHGRATLAELRRLLGVIRAGHQDEPPRTPQPGLADLSRLVESHSRNGARVSLAVEGTMPTVPASLELAVYRVVQECLTNAGKHAPGAAVSVRLRWGAHRLDVDVQDHGAGRAGPAAGSGVLVPGAGAGLRGIQERVRAYGGRLLHAGPTPEGFRVHAVIPLEGDG